MTLTGFFILLYCKIKNTFPRYTTGFYVNVQLFNFIKKLIQMPFFLLTSQAV
jgi:hypothetical protein